MSLDDALGATDPQADLLNFIGQRSPDLAQNGVVDPQTVVNRLIRKQQDALARSQKHNQKSDFAEFGSDKEHATPPADHLAEFGAPAGEEETPRPNDQPQEAQAAPQTAPAPALGAPATGTESLSPGESTAISGQSDTSKAGSFFERRLAEAPVQMAGGMLQGASALPDVLPTEGDWANTLNNLNPQQGTPASERPTYKAGEAVKKWGELTTEKERAEKPFQSALAGGLGGVVPFLALGALNPVAAMASGAAMMGLSTAGDTYEHAIKQGAPEDVARQAAAMNGLVGAALGSLPLASVLKPFTKLLPTGLPVRILAQAGENGIVFTTVGEAQEYIGQQIAKEYDPKAGYEPDINRILGELATGGILGGGHAGIDAFKTTNTRAGRRNLETRAAGHGEHAPKDLRSWSDDDLSKYVRSQDAAAGRSSDHGRSEERASDDDILRGYGHFTDEDIAGMTPEEKAAIIKEAEGTGHPSGANEEAEPGTRDAPIEAKTPEDIAKAAAAASTDHTHAQGEANNVQRGHMDWNGIPITLEVAAGGTRKGLNPETGEPWETSHTHPYGYIKGTVGADGMHVDASIGPGKGIYVIDERDDKTGEFRQHKAMIGFDTPEQAIKAYAGTSSKRPEHLGGIREMSVADFKSWLKGDTTKAASDAMYNVSGGQEPTGAGAAAKGGEIHATAAHREAIEKVLRDNGIATNFLRPRTIAQAAEIHAHEGLDPKTAWLVAFSRDAVADGLLTPDRVKELYGEEVANHLEPVGGNRGAGKVRPEARGPATTRPAPAGETERVRGGGEARPQEAAGAEGPHAKPDKTGRAPGAKEPDGGQTGVDATSGPGHPETGPTGRHPAGGLRSAEATPREPRERSEAAPEHRPAEAAAEPAVGSDAGNGFVHAPEGRRVRVSNAKTTGGVLAETRTSEGRGHDFYVGKDGSLIDAHRLNLAAHSSDREKIWRPPTAELRAKAEGLLRERALLPLNDPKRSAILANLKRLVSKPPENAANAPLIGEHVEKIGDHKVTAADGASVNVKPVVVEADDLITSKDEGYDKALQPRQRDRAQAQAQVRHIATNLEPEMLGRSAEADRGAPIVGPDRQVESGNGRVDAIRAVYRNPSLAARARAYRDMLREQGVDVDKYKEPVLVRQRVTDLTPEERQAFTVAANQATTLTMSAPERAMADAGHVTPDMLDLIKDSDLGSLENRAFVRAFVGTLPASERGNLTGTGGSLSAEGLARVRNAILAKAYGDADILARITESTDDDVKSISNALVGAAPTWAKMRAEIDAGRTPEEMDITTDLMEAVKRTADIRSKGMKVDDYLAQDDAFDKYKDDVDALIAAFYDKNTRRALGVQKIRDFLEYYAREAAKVSTEEGLALGLPKVTPNEIREAAIKKSQGARPGAGNEVSGGAHGPAAPDENRPGARGGGVGRFAEDESRYGAEPGAEGRPQLVIPGSEQRSGADLAKRRAAEPLKPKVAQKPAGGLFGDDSAQLDLVDQARKAARPTLTELDMAFQKADDAWSAELQKAFSKEAGDKRYSKEGRGEPGSALRKAYDARDAARQAREDRLRGQEPTKQERAPAAPVEAKKVSEPAPFERAYHGTFGPPFENFDPSKDSSGEGAVYFSSNQETAKGYIPKGAAGARVISVDLPVSDKTTLSVNESDIDKEFAGGLGEPPLPKLFERARREGKSVVKIAKSGGEFEYVVLDPSVIKILKRERDFPAYTDDNLRTVLGDGARTRNMRPEMVQRMRDELAAREAEKVSTPAPSETPRPQDAFPDKVAPPAPAPQITEKPKKAQQTSLFGWETPDERLRTGKSGAKALDQVATGKGEGAPGGEPVSRGGARGGGEGTRGNRKPHEPGLFDTRGEGGGAPDVHSPEAGAGAGGRRAGAGVGGKGARVPAQPAPRLPDVKPHEAPNVPARNYRITDETELGKGAESVKFRDNLAAIEALKKIEAEDRRPTPAEQRILARYVGWGAMANAFRQPGTNEFKPDWKDRGDALEALLTKEEARAAQHSTTAAHYTSKAIVDAAWKIAERLGFKGGLTLETSMGTGNFLGLIPERIAGQTRFVGVELDSITARIAKALYPQETVLQSGFQKVPLPDGEFVLSIGNPPFGSNSLRFQHKPELHGHSIHNQFFMASLDALQPGGLHVAVVSHHLLDAEGRDARLKMAAKADLLGAIRLPDSAFKENARTEVVTDLVAMQRRTPEAEREIQDLINATLRPGKSKEAEDARNKARRELRDKVPWLDTAEVRDPLGGEPMKVNRYFANNPDMVVGRLERSGKMHGQGEELNVKLEKPEQYQDLLDKAVERMPKDKIDLGKEVIDRTLKRFTTLSDSIKIALRGLEPGHLEYSDKGELTQITERETAKGDFEPTKRVVTADTPWSRQLAMDNQGRWFTSEPKLDAKGAKVKQGTRNVYERKYFPNNEVPQSLRLGAARFERISDLTKLRDALRRQIELETQDAPPKMMEGNRGRLAAAYRAYTEAHGLLHEPRTMQLLNEMPDGPLLMSLESGFRPAVTNTKAARTGGKVRKPSAKPAAILSKRVILKYEPPTKAASPADALAISLSERGHIDVPRVAELLDIPEDKVGEALSAGDKPLAFYDPELQQWEARSAYLSGQVRRKLAAARGAGLEKNVQELEAVQPEEWTADQVTPLVGSNWIAPKHYEDFAKHLLGVDKATVQYSKATNSYNMLTEEYGEGKRVEWGTPDMPPDAILRGMLNSRLPKVMEPTYDQDGRITGERVDKEKSALVVLKAREIEQAFADWVYKDGDRRRELVGAYNDKMNTHAPRQDDGRHLTLPGKSPDISLRRHIYNAIWRGIYSRNLLLDHVVGAGKTFAAIGRIMERRRMGLSQKPMIAVPNHLVEQWAAEALRLYPGAKVLAAGKSQFDKKSRRRLFARIATGDWDMVIVPHSSFGFIGISPETETRFLEDHLRVAQQALRDAEADSPGGRFKSYTVKQAERLVSQIEARMDALRGARRDNMLTFEQMGVDDLTVDEAHEFKNLFYTSRMTDVRGMGPPGGSQKAFDLYNKVKILNESPTGSTTFLTGTPISNSAVEMYTMMRYLAAKELRDLGLEHFDAWRSQFVSAEPKWEPTESGKGLKEVTRLGRSWSNMRALMNLYRSFTDSVTQEDINRQYKEDNNGEEFPIPKVAGGDMQTHVVQPTPAQVGILEQVIDGFDHLDEIQDPDERNAERLRLMGRARKVSLDARVAEPGHPSKEEGGKLETISNEVARIYKKWNADKGTQLIFLDRSVPKSRGDAAILKRYDELVAKRDDALAANDEEGFRRISDDLDKYDPNEMAELRRAQAGGWNAYQQIKDNLIARGIPADEIRFIQEANTDAEKKEMIDSVNAGETRVLIGSTQRMGPGMNAQERLVAGHHGDVTWKPSDIEQRRGRWIRQGNKLYDKYGKDFEVEEHNYVTERTIDAKMWDLNAEKLRMVNGIRKYDGAFNMEFADEEAVSMAEIAALASGDPLLMERVKLGGEIEKLEMQERGFRRKMAGIEDAVDRAKHAIAEYPAQIAATRAAADDMQARRDAVLATASKRSITIEGKKYGADSVQSGEANKAAQDIIDAQKGGDKNAKYKINVDGEDITNQQDLTTAFNKAFGDREPFEAAIGGETYTRRWLAAKALAPKILEAADGGHKLGRMLGADLEAEIASSDKSTRIVLGLTDDGKTIASSNYHDIPKDLLTDAGTFAHAIDSALNEIDRDTRNVAISRATHLQERIDAAKKALPELEPQLNQQSPHTAKLQEYRNKLRDVINTLDARTRAKAAGDDRPTAEEYVQQAMRNLLASSRTAQGTGGLATTPQKATSIVEGLDKTQAKAVAQRNFESTIRYLFDNKDKLPTSGPAMEQFIDNIAERINRGIVKPGEINRSVETVHPNMTRAADLPYAHAQFAEELAARLADRSADPVETAAWIIWRANLIHHFWSDGVGKTSNALAAIPLMKAGRSLPIAAPMSEYVSFAPEKPFVPGSPGNHYTDHAGWERFNAYYHEMVRAADPGATAAVRNSPELKATEEEINTLQRALARRDHPEMIEEHPLLKRAYKLSNEFPLTNERPGYGTIEDRASSVYDFNGERVVGYDAAVDRLIAHAKSFAPGGEVRNERKAYILTGPGGAGKSTIAANPILRNAHAALVDADEAKKVIPGFRGGLGASAVHGESTDIMYGDRGMPGSVFTRLVGEGANLVIGKIGHNPDSIRRLEHELAQDGYDVNLINLEINPEEAFRRRIGRFLATLRVNSSGYRGEIAQGMGRQSAENYYVHKAEGKFHETANLDVNGPAPRVLDGADTSLPALIGIRAGRPGHGEADRGAPRSAEGETSTEGLTAAFAESGSPWSDRASRDLGPHNFVPDRPVAAQAQDHVLFMGRTTGNEHLLAVDHRAKAVANFAGTKGGVNLSADATNKMLDPTNQIVVHHNHPSNGPLSDVDLSMLGMPGIKSIWAHGHEGRVTRAGLTPFGRTLMGRNPEQDVGALSRLADRIGQQHIQPLLTGLVARERIEPKVADHLHAFLVGDILRRAGLIDYHTSNAFEAEIEKHGLEPYIQRAADAVRKSIPNVATANPVSGDDRRSGTVFRHPGDVGAAFERRAEPPARRPEPGAANRAGGAGSRQQAPPARRQLSLAFAHPDNVVGFSDTNDLFRQKHDMQKHVIFGLPLNPLKALEQLKGCSFCVSYGTRAKLGRQLDDAIRLVGKDGILLVDNGAFSLHKKGGTSLDPKYIEDYEKWAQDVLDRSPQAVAVIPDVIGGTEEQNAQLVRETNLPDNRSMPIWHLHESLDYLRWLMEGGFDHLGFGSSGQYWKVGTPEWHRRIDEAFAAIKRYEDETGEIRPRIHMMRAQSQAHLYPFDSSDSTNVAMNHGRYRGPENHVAKLAQRVAGKVEASATGQPAEHQVKRPLDDHLQQTQWEQDNQLAMLADWFGRNFEIVRRQGELGFSEGDPHYTGEKIVTPAIEGTDGQIYTGMMHTYAMEAANAANAEVSREGFLTSHGRFVDRAEAWKIASAGDQIGGRPATQDSLGAEDLKQWNERDAAHNKKVIEQVSAGDVLSEEGFNPGFKDTKRRLEYRPAVRIEGKVYEGYHHGDAYERAARATGRPIEDLVSDEAEGFKTEDGFLTRKEAYDGIDTGKFEDTKRRYGDVASFQHLADKITSEYGVRPVRVRAMTDRERAQHADAHGFYQKDHTGAPGTIVLDTLDRATFLDELAHHLDFEKGTIGSKAPGVLRAYSDREYHGPSWQKYHSELQEKYPEAPAKFEDTTRRYGPQPPRPHGATQQPANAPPRAITKAINRLPVAKQVKNFWTSTFQPELVSDKAFAADPLVARYKSVQGKEKDQVVHASEADWEYWNKKPETARVRFLDDVETAGFGNVPSDPREAMMARRYRRMLDENWAAEKRYGSQAAFVEDYMPHIWERPEDWRSFSATRSAQVGPTWFQKPRTIDYITDGLAAGMKLKYTNPVDIITHRLLSGADMRARMDLLYELKKRGLAWEGVQGGALLVKRGWRAINAPDRKQWVIAPDIQKLWENGVEAKGLWQAEHAGGSVFRGWMAFKNAWVPIKLALSAFHPLHVMHIDQANSLARGWDALQKGHDLPAALKAMGEGIATIPTLGMIHYSRGAKARAAWVKPEAQQTPEEKATVALMQDGGFVPQLSEQLKIAAKHQFAEALAKIQRGEAGVSDWRRFASGLARRPIEKMQGAIFEKWIPALKASAYLDGAADILKRHPEYLDDDRSRRIAMRALAKSIDNRFGEMHYGTLFWNRTLKDASIGSFLSLGWNLGFVREFGGAAMEAGTRPAGLLPPFKPTADRKVARDATNKIAFVISYGVTAAMINGLMTLAFTGETPTGLDYIFARIGGNNPDGTSRRITNMFYLREIPMLIKHIQERGGNVLSGLGQMVWNKLMFEPFAELANNRNYYGYNIWDENAPVYKQIYQAIRHTYGDQFSPMSVSGARHAASLSGQPFPSLREAVTDPGKAVKAATAKGVGMSLLGFGPAPAYVEKSAIQNRIAYLYQEHVAPGSKPEEQGENTEEKMAVRQAILIAKRDQDWKGMQEARQKARDLGMTQKSIDNIGKTPTDIYLFSRLPNEDQKALLQRATPEERARYFPHAHSPVKHEINAATAR